MKRTLSVVGSFLLVFLLNALLCLGEIAAFSAFRGVMLGLESAARSVYVQNLLYIPVMLCSVVVAYGCFRLLQRLIALAKRLCVTIFTAKETSLFVITTHVMILSGYVFGGIL